MRFRFPAIAILAAIVLFPASAFAQLKAAWPTHGPRIETYESVDECLAATYRAQLSSLDRNESTDTLPERPEDLLRPLDSAAVDEAKLCSAKFKAAEVPLGEYALWMELFLRAGRDLDAKAVFERERSAVKDRVLDSVLQTATTLYLSAKPARIDAAIALVEEMQTRSSIPWSARVTHIATILHRSVVIGDTVNAHRAATWLDEIANDIPERERSGPAASQYREAFIYARTVLRQKEMLDSLRVGTKAYAAFMASLSHPLMPPDSKVGTASPAVEGNFWFPQPPGEKFPTPGHVTLIFASVNKSQWGSIKELGAIFRRYKARFPTLDIVVAIPTVGYFQTAVPPTPEQEAQYWHEMLQDFYGYPGFVTVTETPFWRLPDPDRRRINEVTSNEEHYGDQIWLIDRQGLIVFHRQANLGFKSSERDLGKLIDVVFAREKDSREQ